MPGEMKAICFSCGLLLLAAVSGTLADAPDLKAVQHPMSDLHAIAKISIPGSPDWVAIGDSVWISNNPKNNISHLDPKTNTIVALFRWARLLALGWRSVSAACGCRTAATAACGAWICKRRSWWLRSSRGSRTRKAESRPARAAFGCRRMRPGFFRGSIRQRTRWFPRSRFRRVRSLRHSTQVRSGSPAPKTICSLAWTRKPRKWSRRFRWVPRRDFWLLGWAAFGLSTRATAAFRASIPQRIKYPRPLRLACPGPGGDIAVGEGAVWVTAIGKPLSKIDPATNRVVTQYVGKGGDALRVGLGSLWLSNHEFHEVWRIDPKGL